MPNATSVGFAYDSAGRRTSLTLPNGIVLSYAYDNDSRITAMSWMNDTTQVGDLEYIDDADGHVVEKTGSLATTGIPSAVSGNTFNLANEMTAFNGTPLSYDLNGNLLNDGTNTYTWEARNHLATLTGAGSLPTTASFIYDALGRRAEKTINQQATAFLYDGWNPVQELVPSGLGQFAPTASMLTGLGIDEFFQRSDINGAQSFITDALGSTLALTTSGGSISTSYTYEPFGKSTVSGQASANTYQFTGQQADSTALDHFPFRNYNPVLSRFISADPLGFGGGNLNLFGYVANSPTNLTDPTGLLAGISAGGGGGGGGGDGGTAQDASDQNDIDQYMADQGGGTGQNGEPGPGAMPVFATGIQTAAPIKQIKPKPPGMFGPVPKNPTWRALRSYILVMLAIDLLAGVPITIVASILVGSALGPWGAVAGAIVGFGAAIIELYVAVQALEAAAAPAPS